MNLFWKLSIFAFLTTAFISNPTMGGEILDIRKCPLDTTIFIDPWAGGSFTVQRVGTNYHYLCGQPRKVSSIPAPGEECLGPYGNLVLLGSLSDSHGEEAKSVVAIYETIKGAPCCGWLVHKRESPAVEQLFKKVKWLEPNDVPKLGKLPFGSIKRHEYAPDESFTNIFGNPKIAMKCFLR